MLKQIYTTKFQKDIKKLKKQKKDMDKLKAIINLLVNKFKLDIEYRDHKLTGEYQDSRECHIEPDWLLIYKVEEDSIIFERTGSHSELFE